MTPSDIPYLVGSRRLLSWSAFAGIIAIVLAMPLNHYLSSRNVAIRA